MTATDYLLGEDSIAVEIYHLDKSAFGLYSLLRDTDGKKIDAGQEGSFSDYYLLFWQGNDLVAVTAHSDKGNDAAILSGIAKELAPALSKDAEIPEYVKVLPQEGIQANSLKYVVGSIGLLNSYPNLAKYFFKFTQGVSASYADGSSVLVLSWKTAAEAKAAMENAVRITAKEDNEKDNIAKSGDDFLLTLGKDSLKAKLKDEKIIFKK